MKQLKRWIGCLLVCSMVISMLPVVAFAETTEVASGTCGENLTWTLSDDGVLTISGEGAMDDYVSYGSGRAPWYDYADQIVRATVNDGITYLGEYAFSGCSSLTNITIPESVTSMGERVFSGCQGLTTAGAIGGGYNIEFGWTGEMPSYAFYGCSSLTSVTIPGSITSIGGLAFYDCSNLANVTISYGITSIGGLAFSGCGKLTNITIPGSITSIEGQAFNRCSNLTDITFSGNAPTIGSNAFQNVTATAYYPSLNVTWTEENMLDYGGTITWVGYEAEDSGETIIAYGTCGDSVNWKLTEDGTLTISGTGDMSDDAPWSGVCDLVSAVIIEDGVNSIADRAFRNCTNLVSAAISGSVTSIGSEAFRNCSNLTDLEIPDSVTSIGGYAFECCTSLASITIPDSVVSVGSYTFQGCSNLKNVVIGNGLSSIGMMTFYNCTELTNVTIGDSVTSIGDYAFAYCEGLTDVMLPDSVTSIGESAFAHCTSLTSVNIPDTVTSIGRSAFYDCSSLTGSITIPDGMTSIEAMVFSGCSGLTGATIGSGVTSIGDNAFINTNITTVKFRGDAPTFGSAMFTVSAKAFYPAGNETWTDEVRQKLTDWYRFSWEPYDVELENGDDDDESEIVRLVQFFYSWDSENQIAYWGQTDLVGSQVTEETDTSFLENVDSLVGQYVLVETKSRDDEMIAPDTLISIKAVETKTGTVTAADETTITIDGVDYATPEGLMMPSGYAGDFVLYHLYEGELLSLETLETKKGILIRWNTDTRELSIDPEDLDETATVYTLSTLADEETVTFLGESGEKYNTNIMYIADSVKLVYHVEFVPDDTEETNEGFSSEKDGWPIINMEESFGEDGWTIPISTYYEYFPTLSSVVNSIASRIQTPAGFCFGLSLLAVAEYNGQIDLKEYFPDTEGDTLNEFGYQDVVVIPEKIYALTDNDAIISAIKIAHISQGSYEIASAERFKGDSDYSELLDYLNQPNAAPLLVSLTYGLTGHTMVIETAVKPIDCGDGCYALMCYDSRSPQLTNELENGSTIYNYEQSYIYINTTTGEWFYNFNGEYIWANDYSFLGTRYIKFYDITRLNNDFFDGHYSIPEEKAATIFLASNLNVSNDSISMFEVADDAIVLCGENVDFSSFSAGTSDDESVNGYLHLPNESYCYTSVGEAEVAQFSNDFYVAYQVDCDATVELNNENSTMIIRNVSTDSEMNFVCSIQNPDGTVAVSADGIIEPSASITIEVDFDNGSAEVITDSVPNNINTVLEINGEIEDEDFHKKHVHSYGNPTFAWSDDNTCTATFTCVDGDDTQTVACTVTSETTPATETEAGETVYTATAEFNGQTYTDTKTVEIPATGHITHITTLVPAVEATCEHTGNNAYYTCSGCDLWFEDAEATKVIEDHNSVVTPLADHSYESVVAAPTCTEQGYTTHICSVCGDSYMDAYVDATGHSYQDGICTECGEADPDYVEPTEPAEPDKPGKPGCGSFWDWIFGGWWDKDDEKCEHKYTSVITEPTCEKQGYTTHTCELCGDSYKDSYTDALGHSYEDGVCTKCGEAKPSKPGCGSIWDWLFGWWK